MRLLVRLIPERPNFPFVAWRKGAFGLSAVALVVSLIAVFQLGLNFGIDFRGGTQVEARTDGPADLVAIGDAVGDLGLGEVLVQEFGEADRVLLRIERQAGEGSDGENAQQDALRSVSDALTEAFPGIDIQRTEVIGPAVSGELARAGAMAVAAALFCMFIYIWIRFEGWQFSTGAIVALVHDVVLTIGMFALTRIEFNLSIIAAILTIVGYSMNDTVVVYDRIRENMRKYKKMDLAQVLNISINNTLSRTIVTSLTTLIALLSLFFLGGEGLRGFSFAMIWGVVIGTYSSIFVAAPVLLLTGVRATPSDAPVDAPDQIASA